MPDTRSGTRLNPADVKPHGTPAAYQRHLRHGEKPVSRYCPPCAQAESVRSSEKRTRLGYVWFAPARMYVRTRWADA